MGKREKLPRNVKKMTTVAAFALLTGCGNTTASVSTYTAQNAASGSQAYLATFGYDDQPGTTVTSVDLLTGPRAGSRGLRLGRAVSVGSLPSALAATPDGRLLLVTDQGNDQLAVVDTATDAVIAHIPTGVEPDAVAVSPDGRIALVANVDDNTVTPVDLVTLRAGRPITVGARPDAVAIGGPGGRTALVADLEGDTVTPVDLSTMTAGAPIAVGLEPDAVALSPDGATALVANLGSGTVTPISMATLHPGPSVPVGPGPTSVAVAGTGPSGTPTAWVASGTNLVPVNLPVLASAGSSPVGRPVAVGHLAEAVAVNSSGTRAWVAGQDATVTAVNLSTAVVSRSLFVGGRPEAIVIPPPRH
jgi:YVTN family beta-propeller protein